MHPNGKMIGLKFSDIAIEKYCRDIFNKVELTMLTEDTKAHKPSYATIVHYLCKIYNKIYNTNIIIQPELIIQSKNVKQNYNKYIPSEVRKDVWIRDKGKCVLCGSSYNLAFDHIIPASKGGSSISIDNIQILCRKCNNKKKDKIE